MGDKKEIYDLPNEMVAKIFKYLEIKDKVKFGETCKWMNENFIENIIRERIEVEIIIKKEWYIGESSDTLESEEAKVIIMKNGEKEKEYWNNNIEESFSKLWKSKLVYDNEKRVYYYNDNYSEFENIYGYKMIEYQHKGNLFAQFKRNLKSDNGCI